MFLLLYSQEKERCQNVYNFAIETGIYHGKHSFEDFMIEKERNLAARKSHQTASLASHRSRRATASSLAQSSFEDTNSSPETPSLLATSATLSVA